MSSGTIEMHTLEVHLVGWVAVARIADGFRSKRYALSFAPAAGWPIYPTDATAEPQAVHDQAATLIVAATSYR